jgi:hypothetical protein
MSRLAVVLPFVALAVLGCRMAPVRNVYHAPLSVPASMTDADLERVIQSAGSQRGWVITPIAPGEMEGRIQVHDRHVAVVTIAYDRSALSIYYKDSRDLLYDGAQIHRNYNGWVKNLERDIQRAVAAPVASPPR